MQTDSAPMEQVLSLRSAIYDQFQRSSAGPGYFLLEANRDAYAAYYTSMYLIQDTGEAVYTHLTSGFSLDPMLAYIEFWGVMQATNIQQDAIFELHKAILGTVPSIAKGSAWATLRETRHLCAGHPASLTAGVPAVQRTFMGRSFGSYDKIRYELYDAHTGSTTHPIFNLRQMIHDYDIQAGAILQSVLSELGVRWP